MSDHIEIVKENILAQYGKFRRNTHPPVPKARPRGEHGATLKKELSETFSSISESRRTMGIETDHLFVIEILSDAISPSLIDRMLSSFRLSLVEEVPIIKTNNSKLVVQFEDFAAIKDFEKERALWEHDNPLNDDILTYAQRRDLFACMEAIRPVSREDRCGPHLKKHLASDLPLPVGMFLINIDVWFNGDQTKICDLEHQIKDALGTQGSKLTGDLFELPSLLLGRAYVNEFTLNALLDLDIIALVDFPMGTMSTEQCELFVSDIDPIIDDNMDENAPLATVLDSGIFSGNPLLSSLIVGEEDFDCTENTPTDLNGHGTGVAGIVAYGSFVEHENSKHVFKPLVRICNGKVMHDDHGATRYVDNKRPEQIIKEAIEYFHKEYHCRVFNLSSGSTDYIYNGGRQMPWAEVLDQLIRDLDIVIIVSAGNVSLPEVPNFTSREELMQQCRDQLFVSEHRLIDPATTALGITVGSIARYSEPDDAPNGITRISAGEEDYMSVFTRVGTGVSGAVKPDFVDYGGNFALYQMPRGDNRWYRNDRVLMEPTLNHTKDKIFKGYNGTSFAAPHVTHVAARLERALETQIGESPSANLIKALLASSAHYSPEMREWADSSNDPNFTGKKVPRQMQRLRLVGYGKVDDRILFSDENQVTLFAEDALDLRSLHLYKIPVPEEFLKVRANKRISIGFSYNPPTRLSRKSYLANNLWLDVYRRIDVDKLLSYVTKKETGDDNSAEEILDDFRNRYGAAFSPGSTTIQNSTLQQRVWEKNAGGGSDLLWPGNEPYLYVLITGKEKFKHSDMQVPQQYALAITFSYDSTEEIELRQKLEAKVKVKVRERVRERAKVKG